MEPNQEKKISRSPVIVVLIILVLALAAVITYLYLKPIKTQGVGKTSTNTTQIETQQGAQTGTQPGTTDTPITPITGTTTKADIDKDIQSLDSLNLSGAENDYGENNLNDL